MIHPLKTLLSKSHHKLFTPKEDSHSLFDDCQGMLAGIMMMTMGVLFFTSANLYTGGVNGLALVIHYCSEYPLGIILMLI
nr:YitT family protein [Gammaproteobacteria bacterium]